jgi:protein involved in polysaccharide export with SLBB domain
MMVVISWSFAEAQVNASNLLSATSERVTSTNYYYARPNDLTIIVNVMGFVQRPGRYEIASTIDLVNLLSLAGGPTPDGAINKVKIARILKEGEKVQWKELHFDLEDLTAVKAEDLVLFPGDVVQVDRTSWSAFRELFGTVTTVVSIASTIALIIYYSGLR